MRLNVLFPVGLLLLVMNMVSVQAKNIYGLYEKVQLPELNNLEIRSKLDTGALTSSFGATDIEFFTKDGVKWVRFKPQVKALDLPVIEKELVRHSKIKTRSDDIGEDQDKSYTKRPVVIMDICFNGVLYPTEVNLTDRSRFNYPLLLGSSALVEYKAVIDPSLKYQSKAEKCKL
ncbi:ATP-dependent zinc protease family protein [Orbus mooreae]|uniref:ATP-dependent zinc protease family protein n=1 Tax=Orbus mooreae TaxID=3074107 RepID=UPI00370DC22A